MMSNSPVNATGVKIGTIDNEGTMSTLSYNNTAAAAVGANRVSSKF